MKALNIKAFMTAAKAGLFEIQPVPSSRNAG